MLKKMRLRSGAYKNSKWFFIAMIILYKILLDYVYGFITRDWSYEGFAADYNQGLYVGTFIWAIIIAYTSHRYIIEISGSSLMMLAFNLLYFIPFTTVASITNFNLNFIVFTILYWVVFTVLYNYFVFNKPVKNKAVNIDYRKICLILVGGIIVVNFIATIYYNGFKLKFDLNNIYENRMGVRALALPTIIGYLKPAASCLILILVTYCIVGKKWVLLLFLTLAQLMNFSFGALKTDFFALFLAYVIGFFYKKSYSKLILPFLVIMTFLSLCEFWTFDHSSIAAYVHRRVLFMPALLSYDYYDFFSQHRFMYLSDSIMRFLGLDNPYSMPVPRLIGWIYYGSDAANCNTGLIGDDYAQFGYFGILFFPVLRVLVMRIWDISTSKTDCRVQLFGSFFMALTFISGTFFSSLLTGGFIVVCLLCYFLPNVYKN